MRKVVLTYGLLSGVIMVVLMVISGSLFSGYDHANSYSMLQGYATMIISLSVIFFAIKGYRDNYSGGEITFGRGFLIGVCISLIASVFYVVGWKIYSSIAMPNWFDQYANHAIDAARKGGASDATILEKTKELASIKEMYDNPIIGFGMVFMEIFPVGLIISAITSLILRRKPSTVVA